MTEEIRRQIDQLTTKIDTAILLREENNRKIYKLQHENNVAQLEIDELKRLHVEKEARLEQILENESSFAKFKRTLSNAVGYGRPTKKRRIVCSFNGRVGGKIHDLGHSVDSKALLLSKKVVFMQVKLINVFSNFTLADITSVLRAYGIRNTMK